MTDCPEQLTFDFHPRQAVVADFHGGHIISDAGHNESFIHNLGHSIDTDVHGSSTNLNGYSNADTRRVHDRLLFSVEPGIYLEGEAGYRTEIDVYIRDGAVIVTGPIQRAITPLLDKNSNI